MKYRIYIDEAGNSDLKSSDNPNHRFLCLTGVIINLEYVARILQPELEAIKSQFFKSHPDDPVIFHRKEVLNAKPPFETLSKQNIRLAFDQVLLNKLSTWDYRVISICIDKKKHMEAYTTWRYDPYHYCLAVMLERYIFFLDSLDTVGDVMMESRGGKEDMRLKISFQGLFQNGTEYLKPDRIQKRLSSCQLKVKSKENNIAGLQLADLLAHPSRSEILYENKLQENSPALFAQKVIKILQKKYYQQHGRMYGKKLL